MADRQVRATGKDADGHITCLCHPGEDWSPRSTSDAIHDIESGLHTYHVPWTVGRSEIVVANGPSGRHLRTDRDSTWRNNLEDLPDC